MSLVAVLDTFAGVLTDELGSDVHVGDVLPSAVSEVPSVTMSISDAESRLAGVGNTPRGTRHGALPVEISVDLADPVLDLGGGERLPLLSGDRRSLTIPNGPLVRADGVGDPPYTAVDLQVQNGGAWEVVENEPGPEQVRPDPLLGLLRFGTTLPPAGILTVRHFVGQWDVVVSRFQGILSLSIAATSGAAVSALTRRVVAGLERPLSGARVQAVSWGAAASQNLGDEEIHTRSLAYRFDAEIEDPSLPAGGGVITRVAVDLHRDGTVESFAVAREGSPA